MSNQAIHLPAPEQIARKTAQGAFALGFRQVLVQGSTVLGGIFLARLLTPTQFGFFAIVLYLQVFLTAFGDAGLAASLVRQHDEPQTQEFRSIFTVQQILVLLATTLLFVAAPQIASRYHLQASDAWLFRLVALSFLFTSLMVIPQCRLERHLAFEKLAVIESVQAIVFNALAVLFAWRGFGAYSFAMALVARSIVGAALANWISPWRIGWHWNWPLVRQHLSFGLSYQGIAVTSLIKDSFTPMFIGMLAGATFVGYISWAAMVAAYPVIALSVLQRLYMPAFARLQGHPERLAGLMENVLWATNAVAAPLACLTLAMVVPITSAVYGSKWLVGLPYFYLLWPANILACSATPTIGLLNALGLSRIPLLFSVIWMAGTWVVGAPFIWIFGPIGFPIANLLVQVSAFWLFRAAKKKIPFRMFPVVGPVWAIALASAAGVFVLCHFRTPLGIPAIIIYAGFGLLAYAAGLYLLFKGKIYAIWSSLRRTESSETSPS